MGAKQFSFTEQLEVGDRGESLFLEYYPRKIMIHPGRDGDFREVRSGRKIELKTDTYNMDKTPYFFIERFSDMHKETPGSVWQAAEHGCSIFCYYFVRHNLWYQFEDLPLLIDRLNQLIEGKSYITVKNRGWITKGYKINREDLSDLADIYTF